MLFNFCQIVIVISAKKRGLKLIHPKHSNYVETKPLYHSPLCHSTFWNVFKIDHAPIYIIVYLFFLDNQNGKFSEQCKLIYSAVYSYPVWDLQLGKYTNEWGRKTSSKSTKNKMNLNYIDGFRSNDETINWIDEIDSLANAI